MQLSQVRQVLVIGGGGREHALAWKAAQSPQVEKVYVAPGNAGSALEAKLENVAIAADDLPALLEFARSHAIDLTIVGPEQPLVAGVVDLFQANGLLCFGPSKAAAQLEGSKSFSKDFLARHNIPTATYQTFTHLDEATAYLRQQTLPLVIKADGLAAGKGVIIVNDLSQGEQALKDMLADNRFGDAGAKVVIEEFLHGEEASFIVMANGEQVLALASSQDHKALLDGDLGPNTGGMGAYSPAPVVSDKIHQHVMDTIIRPTLNGMISDGIPYCGFLYAGLMIDTTGQAKVLEFNCRFGDPETQPIMMRMKSDLVELCLATLQGDIQTIDAQWDPRASLGVVMAAGGYPEKYNNGDIIYGLPDVTTEEASPSRKVFHAGSKQSGDNIVTAGGRVLCVVALGDSVAQAQQSAYQLVRAISWNNVYYRNDIGYRAVARETS